jgi:hypothetical protein
VLDDLRIIVEPAWREIEGIVRWHVPAEIPGVWAEPYGLLQAFLNLVQNSHRAVQDQSRRELSISVSSQQQQRVLIAFDDSGPGVASPEDLFVLSSLESPGPAWDSMCRVSSYGASAETCASRDDRKNPVSSSN